MKTTTTKPTTLTYDEEQAAVRRVCDSFPATFGLRAFPGDLFRVSRRASYYSKPEVQVYTQIWSEGDVWLDFAKGTEQELRRELMPAPAKKENK